MSFALPLYDATVSGVISKSRASPEEDARPQIASGLLDIFSMDSHRIVRLSARDPYRDAVDLNAVFHTDKNILRSVDDPSFH